MDKHFAWQSVSSASEAFTWKVLERTKISTGCPIKHVPLLNGCREATMNLIISFSVCRIEEIQTQGALSTCTYGEVSPIFLGQNVAKSDIFGSIENLNYVHDIF